MYNATPCEEGFICGLRTTVTVMRTTPAPEGYYTKPGAAAVEWAYLCPAERYCAQGTSDTKQKQSQCLNGFYCPLGTAATLQLDGTFAPGIHMVPREPHIERIKALLASTKEELRQSRYEKLAAAAEARTREHDAAVAANADPAEL